MTQDGLKNKDKDLAKMKKHILELLDQAWIKGYIAGCNDGYATGRNGKPPELSPELKRYVDYMIARAVRNITVRYDWHDAKKEKPKTNGVYIVTRRIGYVDTCYFDGSDTWHDDTRVNHGREYINDIVAWMELPEPWRKEE